MLEIILKIHELVMDDRQLKDREMASAMVISSELIRNIWQTFENERAVLKIGSDR